MHIKKAIETVSRAEAELRALIAQASQVGDYDAVLRLTRWAQSLAELVVDSGASTDRSDGPAPVKTVAIKSRQRKQYPSFSKAEDALVKTGWSPKSRSEYEHRAPLELVQQLAIAAQQLGSKGRLFQLEALARTAHGDGATPGYQLYVVVAWWRATGLIDQHGRKGYSIPKPATLARDVEVAFGQLESR
jgi:hypothetical protein